MGHVRTRRHPQNRKYTTPCRMQHCQDTRVMATGDMRAEKNWRSSAVWFLSRDVIYTSRAMLATARLSCCVMRAERQTDKIIITILQSHPESEVTIQWSFLMVAARPPRVWPLLAIGHPRSVTTLLVGLRAT